MNDERKDDKNCEDALHAGDCIPLRGGLRASRRRDAARHVQKDPEASLTWVVKDEIVRRGHVYYAKLAPGKTMFPAPRMIPHFHAVRPGRGSLKSAMLDAAIQRLNPIVTDRPYVPFGPAKGPS